MSVLSRVIFDTDVTPPSIPLGLTATAVSSTRIDLSWSPATDTGGSGLAGYELLRNATTPIVVGVQTSYSDTGLSPGTSYSYRVRARDGNSNVGAYGAIANATTTGGGFNPGNPDFYDDFSGASIARVASAASKTQWATDRGWEVLMDANTSSTKAGYIYTVQPSNLPANVNGPFPFPSQRGIMLEGDPQGLGGGSNETDYYLGLGGIAPHHWLQFWLLFIDDSATTNVMPSTWSAGNKFLYYADEFPGGFFLINTGWRSFEHQDPSYTAGQRSNFEAGNVPHNEAYWDIQAAGPTPMPGEDGRMVNTNCVEGTFTQQYQNISKKHLMPNVWTLFKFHIDMTQTNGIVEIYMREADEATFTQVSRTPVPGLTWPTDPSLYSLMTKLHFPVVENYHSGTGTGRNWKVMGEPAYATSEADLPTYPVV